jgi:hypothetical protein
LCANVTKDNTAYTKPWNAEPWDESNVNDDHDTPYREDYRVAITDGTDVVGGQVYGFLGFLAITLTVGETYRYTAGNSVALSYAANGPAIAQDGETFVATNSTAYVAGGFGTDGTVCTATVAMEGTFNLGSAGVVLDRMQESLHHFRLAGRQGRSVAIELVNTQGRVRWQGVHTVSGPGRMRLGIQT